MIRFYGTVLAGLLGLAFGSFLNVCLSRWPAGESVVRPGSHCRSCGRTLAWWENIPLLSWLALRGRCRTCQATISWRYPAVELAVGALWAIAACRSISVIALTDIPASLTWEEATIALGVMFFAWVLVALAFLDAEHLWLPDWLTLPAIALGVVFKTALASLGSFLPSSSNPNLVLLDCWDCISPGRAALMSIACAALAALLILLIRWIYKLIRKREGIGLGDAKLMAMLGAWLGLQGALLASALGVVLGAVVAVILLASRRRTEEPLSAMKLPLGTFLCVGGIVTALWGPQIINAYAHYAGF